MSVDESVVERMNTSTRIIITTVLIGLLVFLCTVDESDPKTILAAILVSLVVAVPLLIAMHVRDEQLKREREAVRRQCERARQVQSTGARRRAGLSAIRRSISTTASASRSKQEGSRRRASPRLQTERESRGGRAADLL